MKDNLLLTGWNKSEKGNDTCIFYANVRDAGLMCYKIIAFNLQGFMKSL